MNTIRLIMIVLVILLLVCITGCSTKTPVTKPVVKNGGTTINAKDGSVMILIPAGKFKMGDPYYGYRVNSSQHDVYLNSYYISMYPVTVEQYRKFCQSTGKTMPSSPEWSWINSHPIVNVSWFDARAYAKWAGCELPSEAQWEKAARGTDGRKYPWGNNWDSNNLQCREQGSAYPDSTAPVGSFPSGVSPYGVLDMAGNAWEWCADWYDQHYYISSPKKNPTGPTKGQYRILRGGSDIGVDYDNFPFECSHRYFYPPEKPFFDIGFRCVKIP